MTKLNYEAIVEGISNEYGDNLNEWESEFIDDMLRRDNYDFITEAQKNKIIQINRKYRARR